MNGFDKYMYELKMHLKSNFWVYFFIVLSTIIGIGLGIVLIFSDFELLELLSESDQTMFDYINGDAKLFALFGNRLLNMFLMYLILFVFSLNIYSSFVSYLVLGYQWMLLALSCAAIINLYGIGGVINALLLILPINLCSLFIMSLFTGICVSRASVANKFKMNFKQSANYVNIKYKALACILFSVLLCVIHSIILPLMLKSFIIVTF